MKLSLRSSLPLAALVLLTACESTRSSRALRDGPPFEETFGAPAALLQVDDVEDARRRLARATLPDTREHHDALLEVVRNADGIEAERLLLLTEAVHGYDFAATQPFTVVTSGDASIVIAVGEGFDSLPPRGSGPYADVLDQLLVEGATKLVHPVTPSEAGRLLARTQSADAAETVAALTLPDVDDGSPEALRALLAEIRRDDVILDVALGVLLETGALEGERAHVAVEAISFDESRLALVRGVAARAGAIPFDDVARWIEEMSFDAGKTAVVEVCADALVEVTGDDLERAVGEMSFDEGRLLAVQRLAPRLGEVTLDDVRATLGKFSFDAGRGEAVAALAEAPALRVEAAELPAAIELASFDEGRIELLRRLAPRLVDGVDERTAGELLDAMSFDDGRFQVLELLRDHLTLLSPDERAGLAERLSFDSGKERARRLLELED